MYLYLPRKVKALNFSLLLHYYVNSGQLLNYVHIDICSRRRLHRMCAFNKGKTPCRMRGIPSNIHQVIKPMDYKIRVCYKISFLKMFLTVLEDGAKLTRFWGELAERTHHVKLPWEKQSSPNSAPVIFRVCHWDLLINGHRESIFQGKLEFLGFKNISMVIKGIRGTNIVSHQEKFKVSTNIYI